MFYEQKQFSNTKSVILNQTYFSTLFPVLRSSRTVVEKAGLLKGMYLLCEGFQITFGLEIAYKQFIECNQPDMISHTQYCQHLKLKDYIFLRVILFFMSLFVGSYVCLKIHISFV